ncbi:MAG: AIPR family protein [Crocosphaera sp.]|nr:AIPR family protein [Crocosphaera sp.]
MSQDEYLTEDVNPILYSKCKEIWKIFEAQNPNFIIHICGNCYNKFEINEEKRFQREIKKYSNFEIEYHLLPELVDLVTSSTKKEINAKIMGIDQRFFEKTGGNIRALIFEIDAKDLIRIVLDNDEIRNATDLDEKGYESLKNYKILEDVFEDNVRVYDKKSKINRSIVETATSEDNENFFYYNNGITITCNHLSYSKRRSPIIELKKIQVVNGSQTIHALYEAFLKDSSKFENVELLCRIYETQALELSTKIAEYTNSQNPVKSRDVRSVDYIQQKLEKELLVKGYFYERKRNQYSSKSRQLRLDAEKVGQTLMAFYNQLPYEAKNRKRFIFGDKYDEVFNDETTADKILLSYRLFEKIESQKQETKKNIINDTTKFSKKSYILYASYYILHIIGELAQQQAIDLTLSNIEKIWQLYKKAIEYLEKIIEKEKKQSQNKYAHASFFRSNKPKKYFEEIMEKENN